MTEQELMLTSLLDCRRIDLYVDRKPLTSRQQELLSLMLKRRKKGEPLQHILGYGEFMGLRFLSDRRALVPRPETELLVEAVIKRASAIPDHFFKILDLGTGSGNIAVSLANNIPNGYITAVDISQEALDLAQANARLNNVQDRINFIRSDLFSCFCADPGAKKTFDMIVSNPPYIPSGKIPYLPTEVRYDPKIALDGSEDGLSFYRRIIHESLRFLREGGFLLMEMGDGQCEAIKNIFKENRYFEIVESITDYCRIQRVIIARVKNYG